ncbi:MAG: periplasmic heavy metal sensor [Desulfarculales bacterium]|jgi:hypothetical protein|nr:periplasmic heavy metal sensor [Desulfarculales bacterium]
MIKNVALTVAAFSLVMILGTAAVAGNGNLIPGDRGKLNREQIDERRALYAQYMQQTLETRSQLALKREQLSTLYAQPSPDLTQIKSLQDEIIDLQANLAHQANSYRGDFAYDSYGYGHHNRYLSGSGGYRHHQAWGDRGYGLCPRAGW